VVWCELRCSPSSAKRGHTNRLLKNEWTSSVVEGPPMFINTMAVGPLEPAAFCVTGGATVALPLLHCEALGNRTDVAGVGVARLIACAMGVRIAIVISFAVVKN
jgi:hypothetical protein